MTPPTEAPVTVLRGPVVEPGDAAPEGGVPFNPEDNFDLDLSPSVKVFVRGEKVALVNVGRQDNESDVEAILLHLDRVIEHRGLIEAERDRLKAVREAREAEAQAQIEASAAAREAAGVPAKVPLEPVGQPA